MYGWRKSYDGTIESLANKPKVNKTPNYRALTQEQVQAIKDMITKKVCYPLMHSVLREQYGYKHLEESMTQYIRRHGLKPIKTTTKYEPKEYNTPVNVGEKCQMDIKYVPRKCHVSYGKVKLKAIERLYEYAIVDEASRKVFVKVYENKTADNTCHFVKLAIEFLGFIPKIIQTDNGKEFTNKYTDTNKLGKLDILCNELGMKHQLIAPATPRHDGKVERFNGLTQKWFYNNITYTDIDDLQIQLDKFLYNYNSKITKRCIRDKNGKRMTPNQKEQELLAEIDYYKTMPIM